MRKWFWSWRPLEELETVAVGIVHEGVNGTPFYEGPGFMSDHTATGSNFFNRVINLKVDTNTQKRKCQPNGHYSSKFQTYYSARVNEQYDTYILSCNSKVTKGCSDV